LQAIERSTKQSVTRMDLPSAREINEKRVQQFKQRITDALAGDAFKPFIELIEADEVENDVPAPLIAAALASIAQGDEPLFMKADAPMRSKAAPDERLLVERKQKPKPKSQRPNEGMETFRLEVGRVHGVKPANIVGAIANEAGLDSEDIGNIQIND